MTTLSSIKKTIPQKARLAEHVLAAVLCSFFAVPAIAQSQQAPAIDLRGAVTTAPDSILADGQNADRANAAGQPNYQKRRAKKPKKATKNTLPPLQPYKTAPVSRNVQPIGLSPQANVPPLVPPVTTAQIASPLQAPSPAVEENPFAPLGIGVGSMRFVPFVENGIGYNSNPEGSTGAKKGSLYHRIDGGFDGVSNWSSHELRTNVRLGNSSFFEDAAANRRDMDSRATQRIDVNKDTVLNLEQRFNLDTQGNGTPDISTPTGSSFAKRSNIYRYGGTIGGTEKFGREALTLRGTIDRTSYDNATLTDGTFQNFSDNNYNAFGAALRAGHEITPGITPFAEIGTDVRHYDTRISLLGITHGSRGQNAKIGSSFELTRMLTGEASVGYSRRRYAEQTYQDARSPTFDSALVWTASPLTTVILRAGTDIGETQIAGTSGNLNRSLSAEISHMLFRNLTLSSIAAYQQSDYKGLYLKQDTYSGTLKAEYALNRAIVLKASLTHEKLKSSSPNSDYTTDTVLVGLRLQR